MQNADTDCRAAEAIFSAAIGEHRAVLERTFEAMRGSLARLVEVCAESIDSGGKIIFFGNGGSAADAQHLATELVVRFVENRAPIPALALTTDSSALTAIGNDLGFDELFSRQIEALGRPGDVAIGISTSGKSENVNRALRRARDFGMIAAALSGGRGGELVAIADPLLIAPSDETARIQEIHILVGHALCAALEQSLGLGRHAA